MIHDLLKLGRCLGALAQAEERQSAKVRDLRVGALKGRGWRKRLHHLGWSIELELDGSANLGQLHRVPDCSIGMKLGSNGGEVLSLSRIATQR